MLLDDEVEQLHALTVFGHNVLKLPLLEYLVDFKDARVVLDKAVSTRLFSKEISLRIIDFDLANLNVFIFLMALMLPVASCSAMKTSP